MSCDEVTGGGTTAGCTTEAEKDLSSLEFDRGFQQGAASRQAEVDRLMQEYERNVGYWLKRTEAAEALVALQQERDKFRTAMPECRCDCVNCATGNHSDCYYKPNFCPVKFAERDLQPPARPKQQKGI